MFRRIVKTEAIHKASHVLVSTLVFSIAFLIAFISPPVQAKDKNIDVALVMDTSASMKKNDPNRLRIEAAKMFVQLLDRNDRVSVISFSNRAYPLTGLVPLNSRKNENLILNNIDKVAANGKFTNIYDAIEQGYEILKKDKSTQSEKHIILMSDGKMDLGNKERDLSLLEKTLGKLTPKLAEDHIRIHTIAFTRKSYIPLLKLAAEDTHGQFFLLENADEIDRVFDQLFQRTKEPEEIPLKQDSFIVDKNVREMTIVASKYKPDSVISLENPDSQDIARTTNPKNIKWFKAEKFDLITIKNPSPGYWRVKFSEGGNKTYILSDLSLVVKTSKHTAGVGTPLYIKAFLSRHGKIVKNRALLGVTKFTATVTSPTGKQITNPLVDDGTEIGSERHDGIYGISYAFDNVGTYKVAVNVSSETFDRRRTLFLDVKSYQPKQIFMPLDKPEPAKVEPPIPVQKAVAEPKIEQPTPAPLQAQVAKEENKLPADLSNADKPPAIIPETESSQKALDNNEDKQQKDNGYSVFSAFVFFILFNIFIAIGGSIYWFYYRRKKQEKSKDIAQEKPVKNADAFSDNSIDLSSEAEEFAEMDDEEESPDLDSNNDVMDVPSEAMEQLSDIDLEEELSSILESEERSATG